MKVVLQAEVCRKSAHNRGYGDDYDVLYVVTCEGKSTSEVEEKLAEVQKAATHLGVVIR